MEKSTAVSPRRLKEIILQVPYFQQKCSRGMKGVPPAVRRHYHPLWEPDTWYATHRSCTSPKIFRSLLSRFCYTISKTREVDIHAVYVFTTIFMTTENSGQFVEEAIH